MSNIQNTTKIDSSVINDSVIADNVIDSNQVAPKRVVPASPTVTSPPVITQKPILPANTIGVRELKNQLTRIVSTVRNEQKEYVVTVHGQPVAVLRPYTEEDASDAWEKAADQEIAEMIEMAKEIGDIVRQNGNSPRTELEKMREESACR